MKSKNNSFNSSSCTQSFKLKGSVLTRTVVVDDQSISSKINLGVADKNCKADIATWWRAYLKGTRPTLPRNSPTLRTFDLFSGSGGLALGFRQAAEECGFLVESKAAIDIDKGALAVYKENHQTSFTASQSATQLVSCQIKGTGDEAEIFGTSKAAPIIEHLVGKIDVLLAGPPCQGHSNLNNHTRRTDERNTLYLKVPAVAIALEAPVVIIENVPGVIHDHRNVVQTTTSLLEKAGYNIQQGVCSASKMGWPQTRKRFFLVATKKTHPLSICSVEEALKRDFPLDIWWAIKEFANKKNKNFMDQLPNLSEANKIRVKYLFDNDIYDLPNSKGPDSRKNGNTYTAVYGRMHKDKPAPTLTGGFFSPGRGRFTHPTERRVLTPREAARIQAFPDDYRFASEEDIEPLRTHLAKWIGDAVPMPLGYAAGLSALMPRIASR